MTEELSVRKADKQMVEDEIVRSKMRSTNVSAASHTFVSSQIHEKDGRDGSSSVVFVSIATTLFFGRLETTNWSV